MTSEYMDRESSRKKFLAPLVVIMLCAVALTGAAYAYSTTVTGNGDIASKYAIIDIYEPEGNDYKATSKFDISDSLTFYTDTDKTGTDLSYMAHVNTEDNKNKLVYKAYLRVNTTDSKSQTQQFQIGDFAFVYNAPDDCGKIKIDGISETDGVIKGTSSNIHIYTDSAKTAGSEVTTKVITENTIYYVEIEIIITDGDADSQSEATYFCNEKSFDEVQKKINSFTNAANELAFTITASPYTVPSEDP